MCVCKETGKTLEPSIVTTIVRHQGTRSIETLCIAVSFEESKHHGLMERKALAEGTPHYALREYTGRFTPLGSRSLKPTDHVEDTDPSFATTKTG
jgi:hypothetical protein